MHKMHLPRATITTSKMANSAEGSAALEDKLVPLPGAKSKLWDYFGFRVDSTGKICDQTKIVCKVCQKQIAYSRNTSNLDHHLRKEHKDLQARIVGACEAESAAALSTPTQSSDALLHDALAAL